MAKSPGKAKLRASLDVVRPGLSKALTARAKKGVEVIHERFQPDGDSKAVERVRIIDHDSNKVLWSGTAAEHRALKRALGKGS